MKQLQCDNIYWKAEGIQFIFIFLPLSPGIGVWVQNKASHSGAPFHGKSPSWTVGPHWGPLLPGGLPGPRARPRARSPWAALPLRPAAAAGRGPRSLARAPRAPVVLGGRPSAPGALRGCPGPGLRGARKQQQNDGDDERADATPPTSQPPVLRVAILLSYCSILCNYKAIEMPSHQTYGGSWKFLTFIDLVIQAVFFGICVLTDLSSLLTRGSGSQEQERQLKKLISLRDWMLAVLAFPVGIFVVAVFWIIYAYDREMIYPKLLDNFIPGWLNHGMHTTVLPFILIEMRTSHHAYPSRSSGLAAICTFSVGYILWVCWVHHVTGMWVYPFLEHIGPGARILFFGSTTILMNFLYLLGEVLNSYIWDTQRINHQNVTIGNPDT
ncbi:androgen-induced gene 1 protein [Mesoplodon densirostris]|uniref:androgen-induced gene 1 protein n=1 Tax=Mesoplodon densirostris TaxID=48708 RepID=UPI0028DD13C1|nr:androgen-induced gene 1 protein [Mesoplodon densirostris]